MDRMSRLTLEQAMKRQEEYRRERLRARIKEIEDKFLLEDTRDVVRAIDAADYITADLRAAADDEGDDDA